jgi:hypothetical protein
LRDFLFLFMEAGQRAAEAERSRPDGSITKARTLGTQCVNDKSGNRR